MLLDVLHLPDPRLKTPSSEVSFKEPELQRFIDDLLETMYHFPRCVGLAAPQVGKLWRVITVDASRIDKSGTWHGILALINPEIVRHSGQKLIREGCLSIADYTGNVLRATALEIRAFDRRGKRVQIKAEGFEAIVLQHELDHLDGKLFLDRVSSLQTDVFRRKNYAE